MQRTINLKKVISTDLRESGMIGQDPSYDVEILCRRGGSPEMSELVKVVIPVELFFESFRAVRRSIQKQIKRAEYLGGLKDDSL